LVKNVLDTDYDVCVATFNDGQWRKKNSIGGTAEASPIDNTGIFYMTATDKEEFITRFIHELCHVVFDDLMGRPDLDTTHYWAYEKGDVLLALKEWDLSDYTSKHTSLLIKLTKKALSLAKRLLKHKQSSEQSRIEVWAEAIKEFEGWYKGSRSWRHNNPGNLRYSKYETDNVDGYSVFPDYETGWKALLFQLRIATDGRSSVYSPDMTLKQFVNVWAPPEDNNNHNKQYVRHLVEALGVRSSTKIKNIV
jgi:hypothetical protein